MCRKMLAFVLCMVMICAAAAPAGALDLSQYRFQSGGRDIPGYDYDQHYIYGSALSNDLRVDENWDGVISSNEYFGSTLHALINVVNLNEVEKGGEGPYASYPVYCFDFAVGANPGRMYTIAELSSFMEDNEKNNRLRAILTHSFPHVTDMTALQNDVNVWLKKTDGDAYVPVQQLQAAEVITATQTAVWSVTDLMTISSYYSGVYAYFNRSNTIYHDGYGSQRPTSYTANNIKAVTRYLMALPPEKAPYIPSYELGNAKAVMTPAADGSFTAAVTVQLKDTPKDDVSGHLHVICGESASASVALRRGVKEYTMQLPGVPSMTSEMFVIVDGEQIIEDVFIFKAKNGRKSSQTTGGYIKLKKDMDMEVRVKEIVLAPAVPATGDSAPIMMMAVLACMSLAALVILRRRRA